MNNIKNIRYPNTVAENKTFFIIGDNCDEIRTIKKNGEMAAINWFQIIRDNKVIAEIKESVCDIYGEDDI